MADVTALLNDAPVVGEVPVMQAEPAQRSVDEPEQFGYLPCIR
jgi:hypothetical protein